MIDHIGAVADFHEEILGAVVEAQVVVQMRSLGLPIEPDGTVAAVKDVVMDIHIQGSMKLDPGDLRAMVGHLMMDMMDAIAVDLAENRAEMADDAALFTF